MGSYDRQLMFVFAIAVLFGVVQSRAVNISNTWMLPEEGFPVFYRYFRDRISWYEADAVCQFHHANLVTADSSSQYDAIRAYLKELDITEKVWIGLSKTSEKPNFSWTDFRPLSGESHWQEALPVGDSQSLCAVMDPAADFLWRPLPCGGPEVAAFICELPIPSWALGLKGCLLTELPSLTVLYIPEQSALELTSDCGLDGTKRIACKGNADREEILRQLTCVISNEDLDEDKPTKTSTADYYETWTTDENSLISKTPKSWTSNTISSDYGMPTRHRRETEDTLSPMSTESSFKEVSTKDVTWQDTHREKTVLTTQHISALDEHVTHTPVTSADADKTTDSTTVVENKPTLESIISNKVSSTKSLTDKISTEVRELTKSNVTPTDQKVIKSVVTTEHSTTTVPKSREDLTVIKAVTSSLDIKKARTDVSEGTSSTTTQEGTVEEYPSAINQGQLFSIIENGTMFDIIELNETESEVQGNKTHKPVPTVTINTPAPVVEISKTTTATIDSSALPKLPTKKYITKKPIQPTKKYIKTLPSKKDMFGNDNTTTQKPIANVQPDNQLAENLTREFEMMPNIPDTSLKLNRTFRKELPQIHDENTELESGGQYGVPRILNLTISNVLDSGDPKLQQQHPQNVLVDTKNKVVPVSETEPKLDAVLEINDNGKSLTTSSPEHRNIQSKVNPPQYMNLDSKTKFEDGNVFKTNINTVPHENIETTKTKETSTIPVHNPIDPRIYMLNHHPNVPKNNDSEPVATANNEGFTQESKVAKEEFLPKSLLGEKNLSFAPTRQSELHLETSDAYAERPFPSDEPKKINRHRNLHTTKQRKFYPYFFSRMLG